MSEQSRPSGKRGPVRIANGQAFWGDWLEAPGRLIRDADIDYLTLDYLAEVTMSLLHKQRSRGRGAGYPADFIEMLRDVLPVAVAKGVRIVTNAGGLNPEGCRDAVIELARELGLDIRVASVSGDDLMPELPALMKAGHELANMDTGAPLTSIQDRLVSANAYIGAFPIAEALNEGAHVVVAGRCTDPSIVVGPLIHEYGWTVDDFDLLARATIAGHVIECGPQATGGNFEGGWWDVPDPANIGYPIVEVDPDGTFVVTKPDGTGGIVNEHTVAEQLLYELGDPTTYLTPDVIADLSAVELEVVGKDRVRVTGVVGKQPTEMLKVSAAFNDGYTNASSLIYSWPNALLKAERAAKMLTQRIDDLGLRYDDLAVSYVGVSAMLGHLSTPVTTDPPEVMLRVAIRGQHREDLERFGQEFAPVALAGPAGAAGFASGRARPSEIVEYWPALISKSAVTATVDVKEV